MTKPLGKTPAEVYNIDVCSLGAVPVFEAVEFFQRAADHKPSPEIFSLYLTFVEEEFEEVREAIMSAATAKMPNSDETTPEAMGHLLKELFDLLWVTAGAINALDVDPYEVFASGAISNLAKIDLKTGKVVRRADGKILKPEGWQKPDFEKFFCRQRELPLDTKKGD